MVKKKIGTIKITRKVTVRQQYQTQLNSQREVYVEPIRTSIPTQTSNQQAMNKLAQETKQLQSAISKAARMAKLPADTYTPQVETVYEEIYKRAKSDEAEKDAIYDVFISHASEDKADFVNFLVEALQDAGISVWYDSLEMQWGKSLREQIDNGIKRSKFAIIVLSKSFFAKKWTNRELDGILAKEEAVGATPLPIWHNLNYQEVYDFSPTLTGLYSLSTDKYTISDICQSFKLILEKEIA